MNRAKTGPAAAVANEEYSKGSDNTHTAGSLSPAPPLLPGTPAEIHAMIAACRTIGTETAAGGSSRIPGIHLHGPFFAADKAEGHPHGQPRTGGLPRHRQEGLQHQGRQARRTSSCSARMTVSSPPRPAWAVCSSFAQREAAARLGHARRPSRRLRRVHQRLQSEAHQPRRHRRNPRRRRRPVRRAARCRDQQSQRMVHRRFRQPPCAEVCDRPGLPARGRHHRPPSIWSSQPSSVKSGVPRSSARSTASCSGVSGVMPRSGAVAPRQ